MRRSVTLKWIASLAFASLVGIGLVAVVTNLTANSAFNRLVLNQAQDDFTQIASGYYAANGGWDGFEAWLFTLNTPDRPAVPANTGRNPNAGARPNIRPEPLPDFAVANVNGAVVKGAGQFRSGDRVAPVRIENGTPILVDNERVGTVLPLNAPLQLDPFEQAFINSTNRALIIGTIGAVVAAMLIGIVLTRQLTRPVRELTAAIRAMNDGQLRQQVPVRTQDELGELTTAFNLMSAEIDRSNRLRRQMTADIAHDLRTPLTVISGYLEGLRDGTLKPTISRFDVMFTEAVQLRGLIDDLRMLSLADAGELRLTREPVAIADFLDSVVTSFQSLADASRVTLSASTGANLPVLNLDSDRMTRVLANLIGNALRHTPEGGRVTISASRRMDAVRLSVCDTGEGIEQDKLPYIFERFYRVDDARTAGESGLGLAIARSIVIAHGGSIHAESAPGEGTAIHIDLSITGGAA